MSSAPRSRALAGALLACAVLAPGLSAAEAATPKKKVNAATVNGLKASKTPKPNTLLALDRHGRLPLSVLPVGVGPAGPAGAAGAKGDAGPAGVAGAAGAKGDRGDTGAKGDTGATGATGAKGETGTIDPSGFYGKDESDGRYLRVLPGTRQSLPATPDGTAALWLRLRDQYAGPSISESEFKVGNDGSLLATGEIGIGPIPKSGCGYRMMWHPFKASFRAGSAGYCGDEAQTAWDEANNGFMTMAGGNATIASAYTAFAMGDRTRATGSSASAMGLLSRSTGAASFAAGHLVGAFGNGSVALGQRAVTAAGCPASGACDLAALSTNESHSGSFVFGDGSTTTTAATTGRDQFLVRASGGVRLHTNPTLTTGCVIPAGSGVLSCTSDRHAKRGFAPVDGQDVLERLERVPVTTWSYKSERGGVRHMGPMAQDFRKAFGLGTDDRSIGAIDEAGVTLAAVKALHERTERQQREIDALKAQVAALAKR